jgi:hypothetical protein
MLDLVDQRIAPHQRRAISITYFTITVNKTYLGLLGAVACATSASAVPIAYGGHYYEVVPASQITWDDALNAALSSSYLGLQGHLVTITSAAEHAAVNGMIASQGFGEMWAGGYQNPITEANKQANWTWVNGEGTFPGVDSTTPYAQWNSGEPNDYYGVASEQHLGLNLGPGFNDEGNLSLIYGYVVEYDPNTIDPRKAPDAGATAPMLAGALALLGVVSRRARK